MTVTEYLTQRLDHSADYLLSDADRAYIASDGIEAFIYKALTNKRFRKWAIDENTQAHARAAIHLNVESGKPIQLTFPFGGYKLWRLPVVARGRLGRILHAFVLRLIHGSCLRSVCPRYHALFFVGRYHY